MAAELCRPPTTFAADKLAVQDEVDDSTTIEPSDFDGRSDIDLKELMAEEFGGRLDETTQWAVDTVATGVQNDADYSEMVAGAFGDMTDNHSLHGPLHASIKAQNAVLENLSQHHEWQTQELTKMRFADTPLGRACWEDAAKIKTDLVVFVREVMTNTADIDLVLNHMSLAMENSRLLKDESEREKPRNRFLRKYTNLAFENFKKSVMTAELKAKMQEVEKLGQDLAKNAQAAADRLQEFAQQWEKEQIERDHARQIAEAEERAQTAKRAAKWSLFGMCGLVALSVVGVAAATICVAATGGAALGPVAFVAAHAGAWACGIGAGVALIGAGKVAMDTHASYKAHRSYKADADRIRREYAALKQKFAATVEACNSMVNGYRTLSENVAQASSKAFVVLNSLKLACNSTVKFKQAVDSLEQDAQDAPEGLEELDDDDETELIVSEIKKFSRDDLLKLEGQIKKAIDDNEELNSLALRCYEEYTGRDVGSTQAQQGSLLMSQIPRCR